MRRAMAQRMAVSHAEIVPATVTDEADIDDWPTGEDVTIRLVRAIASACKAEPALNAWYNSGTGERRLIERVVSPSIPRVASSFPCCATLPSEAYRTCGADLTGCGLTQSRAPLPQPKILLPWPHSIPPEELRSATITLSNFGMIGGRFANLIIVPPQAAIVGAGRICQRVVAHRGQPAVRRLLPLSLTFDHRVVTGGEAARFLVALKSNLERIS
jgi:pyruvate dehydrogenase E2 component (dihydrolipoamide acetyltransferase)